VTLYHGGNIEGDVYRNVSFDGMKKVTVMFDERPSFSQIFARACEEIRYNLNDSGISIEDLLSHVASSLSKYLSQLHFLISYTKQTISKDRCNSIAHAIKNKYQPHRNLPYVHKNSPHQARKEPVHT
jgi:hypothetical protein